MLAALGVVVGQNDDIGAAQVLGILVAPFLDATGIRRRRETDGVKIIDVFLAFGDVDNLAGGHRLDELGQPIRYAARVLQIPDPAAATVRPALSEILRLVAYDLEQDLPGLVGVVVDLDDPPLGLPYASP